MSKIKWMKLHGEVEVAAYLGNCNLEHADPDLGFGAFRQGTDEVLRVYRDYIARLDKAPDANLRSSRVTAFGWYIPAPQSMGEAVARSWFGCVDGLLRDRYGERYLGMTVTLDGEPHAFAMAIPEVDGRLNGKAFSSPTNYRGLDKLIDKMTATHFPENPFGDSDDEGTGLSCVYALNRALKFMETITLGNGRTAREEFEALEHDRNEGEPPEPTPLQGEWDIRTLLLNLASEPVEDPLA